MGDMVVAMILSFFFPGIGQAYLTKKWAKGVVFLVASWILSFVLIGVLVWLYGLYDTYKIAKSLEGGEKYKSPVFG